MKARIIATAMVVILTISIQSKAKEKNDPRGTFNEFIKAQNQHDLVLLSNLLLDSQDFLWITKGLTIWGKDEAIKRFENLYKGTWTLDPDLASLKIITLGKNSRQIFVPITFSIGEKGQESKQIKFLMNMILIKKSNSWKVASILPIQSGN
ncbi:MAG: hypothetical protein ABIT05_05350 [Chitinophagaceae bacterium]